MGSGLPWTHEDQARQTLPYCNLEFSITKRGPVPSSTESPPAGHVSVLAKGSAHFSKARSPLMSADTGLRELASWKDFSKDAGD